MYDIIPDIHGQFEKLESALGRLGYRHRNGAWRHPEPGRICVFLGDFIDRGPRNADVIKTVRNMLDAGTARAVMGNHELNAIHFHSNPPLRPWNPKNLRQHKSFLDEFPPGAPATREVVNWMRSLPLYLELDGFRAVHACWDEARIARLDSLTKGGVLSATQLHRAANPADPLHDLVETVTKGPETTLPDPHVFLDKDGTERREVRVKWWNAKGRSWADIAMSVPDPASLPKSRLPADLATNTYPPGAVPVFFGHYWMTGRPVLQAANALCLDYSAGKTGPLLSYHMVKGQALSLEHISGPQDRA